MRPLRRFLKRLSSWARTQQDEERLRAEIEEHLAMHESTSCRIPDRPTLATLPAHPRFDSKRSRRIFGRSLPIRTAKRRCLG